MHGGLRGMLAAQQYAQQAAMGGGSPTAHSAPTDTPAMRRATSVSAYGTPSAAAAHTTATGPLAAAMLAGEDADADAMEAVENLLETYYMYIDNAYDKLMSLGARV